MNANTRFSRNLPCVWALLALSAGCAGLHLPDPPIADVTVKRQQRTEEVVREFESKRDHAEFQAALAHWNQGNVEASEQGLQRLLKRNPDHRQARLLMAQFGQTDEPSPTVLDPAEQAPRDAAGEGEGGTDYYELAAMLVGKRSDRPDATASSDDTPRPSTASGHVSHTETSDRVDHADSAETAETDRFRALFDKGCEALAEDSDQAALVHFRKAAAAGPNDPQIPIAGAVDALRRDRPDLAIELLDPARRRFSGSAQLHRVLGVAFYRLGDYQSSQVALRQALSLDKSSALSYFLMGCTLSKLGQFESAEAHWQQARAIDPRYTPIR